MTVHGDSGPLRLAFYGDDFTGSTDALEVLAFAGLRCALFLDAPTPAALRALGNYDAIGIAGHSRGMSPAEMDETLPGLFAALRELDAPLVHYKVCSTFDSSPAIGNIAHVVHLGRQVFGDATVPVVAGTPMLGRYCAFGNLFARSGTDGRTYRIDRHPIMSVHPVTPMHEGDLAAHLRLQAPLEIENFALPFFELDASVRQESVEASRAQAMLFDATTPAHLTEVGRLLEHRASGRRSTFVVGSSGVEYALTQHWRAAGRLPAASSEVGVVEARRQVLAVSGSASALSALQIDAAVAAGFEDVAVDASALVDDARWPAESQRIRTRVTGLLRDGRSVVVHTARGPGDARIRSMIDSLVARGDTRERARHEGGRLLGDRLGEIVAAILVEVPQRRLVLSGGDTSSQIMRTLAPAALEIAARLAPGAPLCRVVSDRPHLSGLEVALKGGQMGGPNYFVESLHGVA